MKIFCRLAGIAVLSVLFTSCIDIFQVIRLSDRGTVEILYRFSIAKMDESAGMGAPSKEEMPLDEVAESLKNHPGVTVSMDSAETDYDATFNLRFSCPADYPGSPDAPMLPAFSTDGMTLYPMQFPDEEKEDEAKEMDEFAMNMLMGMKYKLLIEKRVVPAMKELALVDSSGLELVQAYADLGDYYLVDVPLGLLLKDPGTRLEFRNTTGEKKQPLPPVKRPVQKPAPRPLPPRDGRTETPKEKPEEYQRGGW